MKTVSTCLRHKLLLAFSLCATLALCMAFSIQAFALDEVEGADNDTLIGSASLRDSLETDGDQAVIPEKTEGDIPEDPITTDGVDDSTDPTDPTDPIGGLPEEPETDVYYYDEYESRLNWVDSNASGTMFAIWRSVDNEECFYHFISLLIDDVELERDVDYKASISNTTHLVDGEVVFHDEGTLIVLYAAPLKAIGAGEHTITALFDDGSFSIPLTIIAYEDWIAQFGDNNFFGGMGAGEENASPEAATETSNLAPQAAAPAQKVPATGDASPIWPSLLFGGCVLIAAAPLLRRSSRRLS